MKTKTEVSHYLMTMKNLGIDPNFYVSLPYLTLSDAICYIEDGLIWIEANDWMLFPPLLYSYKDLKINSVSIKKIWSDFDNLKGIELCLNDDSKLKFLDWEYIFNPIDFKELSGKKWETYRKNIRKWPKRNPNWEYTERLNQEECFKLLGYWFEEKADNLQDAELMLRFIENDDGIFKKGLYNKDKLVAINIWDENYRYINYRYCFVDHCEPFLDEFTRYLFYTDQEIVSKGKFINDGGIVGNPGLERFKDKLNPFRKRKVHSYII